jgi:hypothetical protein
MMSLEHPFGAAILRFVRGIPDALSNTQNDSMWAAIPVGVG